MKTIIPEVGSWLEELNRSECAEEKQHQKDRMLEIMLSEKKVRKIINKNVRCIGSMGHHHTYKYIL